MLSVGIPCGIILSVITPVTSFFITGSPIIGAIPAIMPCIMAGNALLVLGVGLVTKKCKGNGGLIAGMAAGSVVKALFMGIVISLILIPNLLLPQESEVHLGKYAELRRQYLKQHRRVLYTNLKTSCRLTEHLAEIEQTAQRMVAQAVAQMAKAEGVTEELKATDPLRWTGLMNNLRHSAEEQVLNDLIYS